MSTLTEKIAEALEGHIFNKSLGQCRCGFETTHRGHRTREHRAHLTDAALGQVAEWLTSSDVVRIVTAELLGRTAPAGALAALSALVETLQEPAP